MIIFNLIRCNTCTNYQGKLLEDATNQFLVYKIIENHHTIKTTLDWKRCNLILFHGTKRCEKYFKNSEQGLFGKGEFMTDSQFENLLR